MNEETKPVTDAPTIVAPAQTEEAKPAAPAAVDTGATSPAAAAPVAAEPLNAVDQAAADVQAVEAARIVAQAAADAHAAAFESGAHPDVIQAKGVELDIALDAHAEAIDNAKNSAHAVEVAVTAPATPHSVLDEIEQHVKDYGAGAGGKLFELFAKLRAFL